MPWRTDVVYLYDGTFQGLLTCVFESFSCKELPMHIYTQEECELSLFTAKWVDTDEEKARRVWESIPKKISTRARQLVLQSFYTCLPDKERHILDFLRLGYAAGSSVTERITDERVFVLQKAVKHLLNEAHLLKGFLRFSIHGNVMVGVIEPKNYALSLIAEHFCNRYPEESFLIYDKTHKQALVYQSYQAVILQLDSFEIPKGGEEELRYQRLWQRFYDAVGVEGRYNPKCRMTHMPKRYWGNMVEMAPRENHSDAYADKAAFTSLTA